MDHEEALKKITAILAAQELNGLYRGFLEEYRKQKEAFPVELNEQFDLLDGEVADDRFPLFAYTFCHYIVQHEHSRRLSLFFFSTLRVLNEAVNSAETGYLFQNDVLDRRLKLLGIDKDEQ